MPTFGWVQEDATEAFLSATQRVPDPGGWSTRTFACPFCRHVADTPRGLQNHLSGAHPVDRPTMLMRGRELEAETVLRERRSPGDVLFANVTSATISIDGASPKAVGQADLAHLLTGLDEAVARVTLSNGKLRNAEPVVTTYGVRIRIADANALDDVDRAFLEHLTATTPSRNAARRFGLDRRCQGIASDYAEGMAEYVLGVLIKEQPHGQTLSSSLDRHVEMFTAALQKLGGHRRPLPHLLCSVMRFALNQFGSGPLASGYAELDAAMDLLRGPTKAHRAVPEASSTRLKACPLDHGTSRLLNLVAAMSRADRWSPVLRNECSQVASDPALVLRDHHKALAIWALTAMRLKAPKEAEEPLKGISAIRPFDQWAFACLEEVSR